jgi:hypothetical protein
MTRYKNNDMLRGYTSFMGTRSPPKGGVKEKLPLSTSFLFVAIIRVAVFCLCDVEGTEHY